MSLDPCALTYDDCFSALEAATHQDLCGRGLAAHRIADWWLDAGELRRAAVSLCRARAVAIVTGFPIVTAQGVVAETDGPPGALFLAGILDALGVETMLIGDAVCSQVLAAGLEHCGLKRVELLDFPFEPGGPEEPARACNDAPYNTHSDAWVEAFLASPTGLRLSHLVAIERAGPSHTVESLAAQARQGRPPVEDFLSAVPPECRNVCQNMRGVSINGHVAKTHRLFEVLAHSRREVVTVGLADGGNELGVGSLPWEVVAQAATSPLGGRIACRIAATHLLLAGVSNWAAYALGAALVCLRRETELVRRHGVSQQAQLIEALVRAGAVDGVTGRREPTVDGLDLPSYLAVLQTILDITAENRSA